MTARRARRVMPPALASVVVFVSAAAVLVLEILATRLLAPYAGVTLETYTAIIATVLAGIATGNWLGGLAADRRDPRGLVGPLLVAGGLSAIAAVPLVRLLGPVARETLGVLVLAALSFFAPAAVLSAVTPTVVKLQLRELTRAGEVVGRLAAIGTIGAIAGTVLAGFVLVEVAPTTTTILAIGVLLVAGGVALWVWLASAGGRAVVLIVAVAAGLGATSVAAGDRCHVETTYHCARVQVDRERPSGRVLVLDTLRHSYVDLEDPAHLEFRYTRVFADVVDALVLPGGVEALHVGGGALTMARWLAATRPGSRSLVLEIDDRLVDLVRRRFGPMPAGTEVRVGDARMLADDLAPDAADVVFGDAYGGLSVPWHLTTVEAIRDVRRHLAPGGVYVLNLIDHPPLRFAKAEARTLLAAFSDVAVIGPAELLAGDRGGNVVLVAAERAIDAEAIRRRIAARAGEEIVLAGDEARAFARGAPLLRDDHAPVDQWLARADRP